MSQYDYNAEATGRVINLADQRRTQSAGHRGWQDQLGTLPSAPIGGGEASASHETPLAEAGRRQVRR
jgi:hypothetical protein